MNFLFLSSLDDWDALTRVQAQPLVLGLRELGHDVQQVKTGAEIKQFAIRPHDYVVLHYKDRWALELAIQVKRRFQSKVLCLCSDVDYIDIYKRIEPVVDIYFAPTDLHRAVIDSVVGKPVLEFTEGIDPIAYPPPGYALSAQASHTKKDRVLWFGYPESFEKSFKYLRPHLDDGIRQRLVLLTKAGIELMPGVTHRAFDPSTFYAETADCGISILSHFSYNNLLNTYIKTPNKLITSLVRGMVPIFSDTPSYRKIAEEYEINFGIFKKPIDLYLQLNRKYAERSEIETMCSAIKAKITIDFSNQSIGKIFSTKL